MILSPNRMKQLIDFDSMYYDKCTPTDIDGMIEYHDLAYIFFELKYGGKEISKGQKLALERLANDTAYRKISISIIADHYTEASEVINARECIVREVYLSTERKWRKTKAQISLHDCIQEFISFYVEGDYAL